MGDVIINKLAIIERCLERIKEEYLKVDGDIGVNLTVQDSIILNLERAIQACIDVGVHLIRKNKLGSPQSSRDVFQKLAEAKIIESNLSRNLQGMVGFRNIAVHDYQALNTDVIVSIINNHLKDFEQFKKLILEYSTID